MVANISMIFKNYNLLLTLVFAAVTYILIIIINKYDRINSSPLFYDSNVSKCITIFKQINEPLIRFTIDNQTYPKSFHLAKNKSINFDCLNRNNKIKKILLWNSFFGQDDYYFGLGKSEPFIRHNCPVINCEITNDRRKLNESDYVITHMRDKLTDLPLHSIRPIKQQWIFYLWESPVHAADFSQFNDYYNLTLTYKIDSNFNGVYEMDAYMYWELNETFNVNHDFYANKSEFATAVISNCGGTSNRLNYIKKLQQFIKVDVFGKCGRKCPMQYRNGDLGDCKSILGHDYKFYFAFENSICTDYITEKFFAILKYNIIPVVLGGGNYEYYIPKSGFINVLDFSSAQQLANYLLYLDRNRTAYNEYFKWKKYVKFNTSDHSMNHFCNLCIQMHLNDKLGIQKSIINNIGSYWSKENCRAPPNFI